MSQTWSWRPLSELFEIGAGKTMSAAARSGADKVPFLRTSNVLWDRLDLSVVDEMAIASHELPDKLVESGDLLVCEGGEIGRAAIWDGSIAPMAFQNHLHRLRPKRGDINPRFYVYFLQSAFTQLGIFDGAGNKTTIPNLSSSRLMALEVPHPPLEEQQAIAGVLSTLHDAISLQRESISTSEELKRAATSGLFRRGIRGESPQDSEIGPIPETWEVVTLGSLGKIGNGSTPKRSNAGYWSGGTFPWLNSAKVYDRDIKAGEQFVTRTALAECHLPTVEPGAVLMAITGQGKTLGNVAVLRTPATISQHLAYIQADPDRIDPDFLRGYLETRYEALRQVASGGGSTKGALTCAFLKTLPVPLPELTEQRDIVAVLRSLDQKIALHRDKLALAEELYQALLLKIMTGAISAENFVLTPRDTAGRAA
ncbi:restriction modification system DNA specificity subunit [Mycobacteroides abscessus]|nr:restriction modification system DNA specificity subunit [Mycobacteroides abscessus]